MDQAQQLQDISDEIGKRCRQLGWKKDWANGGVYIHLEVSEFIEALRGKGKSTAISEAADVLISFTAVLDHHDITIDEVFKAAQANLERIDKTVPKQLITVSPHYNEGSDLYLMGPYHKLEQTFADYKTSSPDSVVKLLENLGYQRLPKLSPGIKDRCDVLTHIQCDKYATRYHGFKSPTHFSEATTERVKPNGTIPYSSND